MDLALEYYAKSLRARELGSDGPAPLGSNPEAKYAMCLTMENVAMIWRDQGQHGEALKMLSKVLKMRRRHCGIKNLEFANLLFHIGLVHEDLGKESMAASYFYQADQVRQLVLGGQCNTQSQSSWPCKAGMAYG